MRTEYDKEADAAYIYIKPIKKGDVKKTLQIGVDVNLDLGKNNEILGLEILNVKTKKSAVREIVKV